MFFMDKDTKTIKKLLKIQPKTVKELTCSGCAKKQREVKVLIKFKPNRSIYICNECVELMEHVCANPQKYSPPANPTNTT